MSTHGNIKIEILDLENASGDAHIDWVMSEGTLNDSSSTQFSLKFLNEAARYSMPLVVRGMGPSINHARAIADPGISIIVNGALETNNNWTGSPTATTITGTNLEPGSFLESATTINPFFGEHSVTLTSGNGVLVAASNYRRGRIDLIRPTIPTLYERTLTFTGDSMTWLKYDLSSGVNNNRVFAYSIEILDQISGMSGNSLYSDLGLASSLEFYSGLLYSGVCNEVKLLLANSGEGCVENEDTPIQVCLSSGVDTGRISGTIRDTATQLYRELNQENPPSYVPNSVIESSATDLSYVVYTGKIAFNSPISGDYVCFRSYSFDYTGEYSGTYGVNPPYPEVRKCWTYGVDYTNPAQLANKINTDLDTDYPLWNRDICVDQSLSGYYETGSLLRASASGNYVNIESQRLGLMGAYEFTFAAVSRPSGLKPSQNSIRYLQPRNVALFGSLNGENWTPLDSRTNVLWERASQRKEVGSEHEFITGLSKRNLPPPPQIGASGNTNLDTVYSATITGLDKCGNSFSRTVNFVQPPSGSSCGSEETDDWTSIVQGALSPKPISSLEFSFLKTGWKFNQLSGYSHYKVELSNFYSSKGAQHILNRDEVYVSNINFYGVESGDILHTGETCLYGSRYTGHIEGYVTGLLTGTLTGNSVGGVLCFNSLPVSGSPVSPLKFNNATGRAIGLFTGLVTNCISGTGLFVENIQGYYWNTGGCVEFTKPVSGYITGSGILSGGSYLFIRDSQLFKLTGFQNVVGSGFGVHTGVIPNFEYLFENVLSFYENTGSVTGNVVSGGCLSYSLTNLTIPPSAKSFALSGTTEAVNVLNYSTPDTGDYILINNIPLIYQTESRFGPLTYFNSITTLKNIINSGSGQFFVTGDVFGTKILLRSVLPGISGNGIPCSASGQFTFIQTGTTSGENHHFPIVPVSEFTGVSSGQICATGYFITGVTGNITGRIKQLDFVREFTGIWNIFTGDIDFRANGGIGLGLYTNSGFTQNIYSGHPDLIPLTVSYVNNPFVSSNDLAKLIVTGYEMNQGIEMILSGQL